MKRVIIVCIQGVTSSVMARKLNILAKEKNDIYHFIAVGIDDLDQYLVGTNFILLTPQVKSKVNDIQKLIANTTCEVGVIGDSSISFNHIELTYQNLKTIIEKKDKNLRVTDALIETLKDAFIPILFIYIVGSIFKSLYSMTENEIFYDIFQRTSGILCVYSAYFIGGTFAKKVHRSSFMYGSVCLLSLFFFSPIFTNSIKSVYPYHYIGPEGFLVISELGTQHMFLYLLLVLFSVLLFYFYNTLIIKKCEERHYLLIGYFNMPHYVLMSIYLITMTVIYYFIHPFF